MRYLKLSLVFGVIAVLTLPAALHAMSTAEALGEVYHPQIREVSGPVMVKGMKYAIWEPVEAGMLLLSGDVLRTDKEGYAVIEFSSGTIELYETTVLIIPSIRIMNRKKDIRDVIVQEGNTLFDINHLGVERGFEFRTKNVQGGVKGTKFIVSYLDGGTSVSVYRGVVQVSDLKGTENTRMVLKAGNAVRVKKKSDFGNKIDFDADSALENYSYNVPPGLDGVGLPSDDNANPDNNGVRDRGLGIGREKDKDKEKDK